MWRKAMKMIYGGLLLFFLSSANLHVFASQVEGETNVTVQINEGDKIQPDKPNEITPINKNNYLPQTNEKETSVLNQVGVLFVLLAVLLCLKGRRKSGED